MYLRLLFLVDNNIVVIIIIIIIIMILWRLLCCTSVFPITDESARSNSNFGRRNPNFGLPSLVSSLYNSPQDFCAPEINTIQGYYKLYSETWFFINRCLRHRLTVVFTINAIIILGKIGTNYQTKTVFFFYTEYDVRMQLVIQTF